jgi:hypothetical protein
VASFDDLMSLHIPSIDFLDKYQISPLYIAEGNLATFCVMLSIKETNKVDAYTIIFA